MKRYEEVWHSQKEWFKRLFTQEDILKVAKASEHSDEKAFCLAGEIAHERIWNSGIDWNPSGSEEGALRWAGAMASSRYINGCYHCP